MLKWKYRGSQSTHFKYQFQNIHFLCAIFPWSPGTRISSPYNFFLAIRNMGNGCDWSYQPTFIQRASVYPNHNHYFFKWAEAIPLREVKTSDVIKFIKHHVVYRFSVPRQIVHDNRPQFVNQAFQRFCDKFRIQSVPSMAYYLAASSLVEAFYKTIGKFLKKFVSKSQHDWMIS